MTKPAVQRIFDATKARIYLEVARQGGTKKHLEVRLLEKMDRILDAESEAEAEALAKKAEDSVFITLLHLRSKGKIFPKTPAEYRKKAEKAESLAQMLYNQYLDLKPLDDEDLKKRARLLERHQDKLELARHYREYSVRLEQDPMLPPFEELYKKEEVEEVTEGEEVKKKPCARSRSSGPRRKRC